MNELVKRLLVGAIVIYQKTISPWLGRHCRFYPSCSQLTLEAINGYGVIVGTGIGIKRILSCHPLHPGGYDPLKNFL